MNLSNRLLIVILILLNVLVVECYKINMFQDKLSSQTKDHKLNSQNNNKLNQQRFLQSLSINETNQLSIESDILNLLNIQKRKIGLSQLILDSQIQLIIQRWSNFFKSSYTLDQYISKLGRFTNSKITDFSNYSTQTTLFQEIRNKSINWISVQRLTQIGIYGQLVYSKYHILIAIKNYNLNATIIQVEKHNQNIQNTTKKSIQINQTVSISKESNTSQAITINNQTISNVNSSIITSKSSSINLISATNSSTSNLTNNSSSSQYASFGIINSSRSAIPSNKKLKTNISNLQFNGLILYHQIPTMFIKTQIFVIKGKLLSSPATDDGIFVNFLFKNINSTEVIKFYTWIAKGQIQLKVFVKLNKFKQGQYQLATYVGNNFTVSPKSYTVKPIIINQTNKLITSPLSPTNLSISFTNNKLYFNWNQDNITSIRKITFNQNNLNKQYILSNYQSQFQVPFQDFYQFNLNPINVYLASAYSSSLSYSGKISQFSLPINLTFNPIEHHFDELNENQIQLDKQIPWIISLNQTITISGKSLYNLSNKIVIEEPSQTFSQYYFNQQNKSVILTVGSVFYKNITLFQEGVYILEVNNAAGSAVINQPIYVGNKYPILPDFQDLKGENLPLQTISNTQPATISEQRSLLLKLINKKRTEFGLNSLIEDSKLDQSGQYHSDDMITRKFFGHYNPSGQGPQQRALKFGITQGVAQNIAMNINLTDAHYRLCRSPAHLINIVNKEQEKVGLGISRDSNQYFYIAEQFAGRDYIANPLTDQQMLEYKTQLIAYIKQLYPSIKSENIKLSSGLSQWQNLSSTVQNSQSIISFLRSKGVSNFSIGNIKIYFRQNFIDNLKKSNYLDSQKANPTEVGLGLKLINEWLQIYIGYI